MADRLAPRVEEKAELAPGLDDPLQVALRLVIAASRAERGDAVTRAYELLVRVDESMLPGAVLHLAAMYSRSMESPEAVREWAEYLLMREGFRDLVLRNFENVEGA